MELAERNKLNEISWTELVEREEQECELNLSEHYPVSKNVWTYHFAKSSNMKGSLDGASSDRWQTYLWQAGVS